MSTKLALVLLAFAVGSIAKAEDFYVAGPVGQLSRDGSVISILGLPVAIRPSTKFFVAGRKVSALQFLRAITPESFVYAEFRDQSDTLEAKSLLATNYSYVAGATPVYLAGRVTAFDANVGRIRLWNIDVDVTNLPMTVLSHLNAGDVVEANGTQPSQQYSLILPSAFRIAIDGQVGVGGENPSTHGISGSGLSAQGISGSGATIQGISGSGITAQGISGSGVSAQGISGSGATIQGISGSGITAQGISGSGVSAQGISGSGVTIQGISGSGVKTQGISGSGISAQGISGNGSTIQGISGSGVKAQGISGSGVSTQGISGSGATTQGISGSGVSS
jgi:hypothetical protein